MRKLIMSLTAMFTAVILMTPAIAFAGSPKQQVCQGAGLSKACDPPAGSPGVPKIIQNSIILFSVVIGVVAVVMVMIAGLKYMTSNGDPNAVASAKNTLLFAVVGIIVAALAQALVRYVLSRID